MYIIKKKIHGREYYYLISSQREKGKVKTKSVAYLGKTRKQAEKKAKEIIKEKTKPQEAKKLVNVKREKEVKRKIRPLKPVTIEDITVFCKRKGFVYASGEIYGGIAGFWDYGVLGTELNNNIKKEWRNFHVYQREDIVEIDGSIITNPNVWEASGHVTNFIDIAVVCKKCGFKTKIDKHELGKVRCEKCNGEYAAKGEFNPMFITQVGPVKEDSVKTYLRPETAQLIFTNFKLVQNNARLKLPFGIAQIGKAFRNEIAPRDFLFRTREFEQLEIEYFIDPKEKCPYKIGNTEILIYSVELQEQNKEPIKMKIADALKQGIIKTDWHAYWLEQEFLWFTNLGANSEKFRLRQHRSDEKSHYAQDTWDLEYLFPFGWKELQGMANRTDFDLKQHEKFSKKDLSILNEKGEKIIPHVVCEPSQGLGRAFLVFLLDAYTYDSKRENIVLKLNPKLSPYKAAVFPLINKLDKEAKQVYDELKKQFNIFYDTSGSIGRRYARQDEIGTPYCITIDFDIRKNKSVTIRDRNTTKQIRVKIKNLKDILSKLLNQEIEFEKAGKLIK